MTKMLSDGRVQHEAVIGRCPKDECAGDLVPLTGWGAWTDERCVKCNCTWCYQVPRLISDIAAAEAAEKRRRGPDLAGQIASLKDHLRIADAQADAWAALARARGAAMQDLDEEHPACVAACKALADLGVDVYASNDEPPVSERKIGT